MYNLKNFLFTNTIFEILKYLFSFLLSSIAYFLSSSFFLDLFPKFIEYKIYIISIPILLFSIIFINFYIKAKKNRVIFPKIDTDYMCLKKEISLEYIKDKDITYKKKLLLKALSSNLNAFQDRYHWTGGGNLNIKSGIKGQKFQNTFKKNVFQFYEILFPRYLKKGDEIETELIWDIKNITKKFVPFISATIHEPTKELVFSIDFTNIENYPKKVTCEITSSIGANNVFETFEKNVENKKVFWKIENPKFLFHYEIKWII